MLDLTPITPEERESNKAFALAKQKRIAKAESWLRSNGVQMQGRGKWDGDDPWALRTLAENLIEAIDKGRI